MNAALARHAVLIFAFILFASSLIALSQSQPSSPAATKPTCESLAQLAIPNATIRLAQSVPAGGFSGPRALYSGADLSAFYKTLPAFCRVSVEANPTDDSAIKIEVWLPASGWNGKLQGLGNGGFAGQMNFTELGTAVSRGYAVTATDTGHTGMSVDATWALGHPEKVIDFGHRGIHEMTRVAKIAIHALYGSDAQHSYFYGCSDGGREALMEAQRYPEDFDGILAGAPANYWTGLLTTAVFDTQALTVDPASFIPAAKVSAIASAVLAACDELDGVRDGILNDPRQCHFDPATIQCKIAEESDKCLTAPQVTALKKIYDGPRDSHGRRVFPGYPPGAEDGPGGWGLWIFGPAPNKSLMALFGGGYFSNMVYEKADWDYKTFALEPGMKSAEQKTASALNATDADLGPFKARGGKLIMYHGWEDPAIPALNTIDYYESVLAKMGQRNVDSFLRLYMIPGMQHCGGGPGPDLFGEGKEIDDPQRSAPAALEQWVEKGTVPSTIIGSKSGADDPQHHAGMTRPLCAYPDAAKYKGTGDPNDSANFVCAAGKK